MTVGGTPKVSHNREMHKVPWIGAGMFVVAALVNAWMIGELVESKNHGSLMTFPDHELPLATSIMVECCLLSAWFVFGATHLAIRGTIVACSVAVLSFEFDKLWGADSQNVRPDLLSAFLIVALLVPRVRGWRIVTSDCLSTPESNYGSRQFSLLQMLMTTCLVAIACGIFRYFWRSNSSPEILVVNLLLGLSLISVSLYGTLACARFTLGVLVAIFLYIAVSALLCVSYCWLQRFPLEVLLHEYNVRSLMLELTLILPPLMVLRRSGFRLQLCQR